LFLPTLQRLTASYPRSGIDLVPLRRHDSNVAANTLTHHRSRAAVPLKLTLGDILLLKQMGIAEQRMSERGVDRLLEDVLSDAKEKICGGAGNFQATQVDDGEAYGRRELERMWDEGLL
jgi:hypothetical protein